ncbi:MAG: ROK family protein [Armatimonadota bacterium]|nr:ROK family protein [Armatimonadota bacterium]
MNLTHKGKMSKLTIGIDIGGTKIAGGLVTRQGNVIRLLERPTNAAEGGKAVMERVAELIAELVSSSSAGVEGIGVATGGQINPETGVVFSATPLLPGWVGMPIKGILEGRFCLPVRVINDASAAALGEWMFGAARGSRNFVLLTIGTGIGGGVFCDGKLVQGAMGAAGAIGHMVIDCDGRPCNCGSRGCLEAYASGTAMANSALALAEERKLDTQLIRMIRSNHKMGAFFLAQSALAGDEFATEVIREAGEYLGWGFVSLLNLFNPELVVVGGSVAEMGDLLLQPAWEIAMRHSLRREKDPVRITKAQLGNNAGLLGAASLIWDEKNANG